LVSGRHDGGRLYAAVRDHEDAPFAIPDGAQEPAAVSQASGVAEDLREGGEAGRLLGTAGGMPVEGSRKNRLPPRVP
jgi:hypothetical protein